MSNKQCCSAASLKAELEVVRHKVLLQETDQSWNQIEHGIVQLTESCNNGGCTFITEMIAGIRSLSRPLNRAMNSKRAKLSGSAIELVTALLAGLGPSFKPLASIFFLSLLGLCAHTNKVLARRAKACVFAIIRDAQSQSLLPYLAESLHHKLVSVRIVAAEGVLAHLNCFTPSNIENDSHRDRLLGNVMKLTSRDVSVDVRQLGKKISEVHKAQLADCPESSVESVTSITKKVAVQGTASSRVLSRGQKTTGIARIIIPLAQKVDSTKLSELPRDICTVKPIATFKETTSARQGIVRPSAIPGPSQLCAGANIPTAPLQENDSTEAARVPRNRRNGPPPFKPISRTRCLISTSDPQNSISIPVRPSSRMEPWPVAKAEHAATRRTSSQINQSQSRLSITDLQMSPKARRLVAPRCNQQAVRQKKPVHGGHAARQSFVPTIAHAPRDVSRTPLKCVIKVEDSTTPKGDPPVRTTCHVQHPYVNVEESTSTTPKGEPPVTAQGLRGVVKDATSTTPKTHTSWPAHCEDIFAPSSDEAYVPPRRVSERLKRAPRLLAYRPPRDHLATPSPSPRVQQSYSTTPKTPLRLPTPSGQYLKQIFSSPQATLPPPLVPIDQWLASVRLRLDALAF